MKKILQEKIFKKQQNLLQLTRERNYGGACMGHPVRIELINSGLLILAC